MRKASLQELLPRASTKEKILTAVIVWLFGLIGCAAYLGVWPRTRQGWILFLVVAPLLYVAAEALGELFAELVRRIPVLRNMTDSIERATREKRFSWLRICYYLVAVLFVCVVIIGMARASDQLFGSELMPIKDFFTRHFTTWW